MTCGITTHAEHIQGVYNTVADAESRQRFEPSDWKLHKGAIDKLQKVWRRYDVDLLQHGTTDKDLKDLEVKLEFH